MPADQRAGDAPAGPEGVIGVSFCTDGLECCSLEMAVKYVDRAIGPDPHPRVLEMRNWLADLYNEYASGERECSKCRTEGGD